MRIVPAVIAIGGCSGSGKSTLARAVGTKLGAEVIPLDSYYRDLSQLPVTERDRVNFDAPDAIEHELLLRHMQSWIQGEAFARPVYEFITHTRRTEKVLVQPKRNLILEGLLALYWDEIRKLCAVKVYVDLDDAECYRRRLERDTHDRGRTAASVERQYHESVLPMAKLNVMPTRRWADVVVSGAEDVATGVRKVLERLGLPG